MIYLQAGCLQKLNVPGRGYMFLKFEPFVLHVMCQDMPAAQQLVCAPQLVTDPLWLDYLHTYQPVPCTTKQLQVAIVAGFRNSGITVGKKQRILLVSNPHCQDSNSMCAVCCCVYRQCVALLAWKFQ